MLPKIVLPGTPESSILVGISIIYHPFWGISIFGNTHIYQVLAGQGWILQGNEP